ncbi:MAG: type II secretion system F family protein [Gammaproteobacteria bacterium]|nr:type II secretion system F family protein [Gammaproteobacteria bacterium]
MMEFFYNAVGTIALPLAVAAVFFGTTLAWVMIAVRVQEKVADYRSDFTQSASANMADMFMFVDPNQLFRINVIALIVAPILVWLLLGDLITTVGVFVLLLVLPTFAYRSMKRKRLARIEAQLPDALTMVAGSLRAGASLSIALDNLVQEQPPPISQEFEILTKEQRLGVDFDVSLANMEKRIPMQDFRMLTTALRINREVGGNLAETIESLADTLRRKSTMEGKIQSLTAQGKLQGIVMTGLPVLLGLLLNFLEPESMEKLWTTGVGWTVLSVIIVMEMLGYIMIKKITSIDV